MATKLKKPFNQNVIHNFVSLYKSMFSTFIVDKFEEMDHVAPIYSFRNRLNNLIYQYGKLDEMIPSEFLLSALKDLKANVKILVKENLPEYNKAMEDSEETNSYKEMRQNADNILELYMTAYNLRKLLEEKIPSALTLEELKEEIMNNVEIYGMSKRFDVVSEIQQIPEATHKAHTRKILNISLKS